jgi:hypothetical protein
MLTRRVEKKPKYSLFGFSHFQKASDIVILASGSFMEAMKANRPMSYINNANTHWIAYYWRNLPIEALEIILTEDGDHLQMVLREKRA